MRIAEGLRSRVTRSTAHRPEPQLQRAGPAPAREANRRSSAGHRSAAPGNALFIAANPGGAGAGSKGGTRERGRPFQTPLYRPVTGSDVRAETERDVRARRYKDTTTVGRPRKPAAR